MPRGGIEPATKRLIVIAGGLAVAVVGAIGITALSGSRQTEVPVLRAEDRPLRVKPENPGGMQIAGAATEIFGGEREGGGSRLAPAIEAPDPKGLQAQMAPAAPPKPRAVPPDISASPTPAPAAKTAAASHPAPQVQSGTKPPATVERHAATAPVQTPAAAAAVSAGAKPAGAKAIGVQLAALSTEAAAREEWRILTRKFPELLNGHQPNFVKAERDGRTVWRVRTGGFTDVSKASGFCERARAKGAACAVAEF